jgi:hypothetical protein
LFKKRFPPPDRLGDPRGEVEVYVINVRYLGRGLGPGRAVIELPVEADSHVTGCHGGYLL